MEEEKKILRRAKCILYNRSVPKQTKNVRPLKASKRKNFTLHKINSKNHHRPFPYKYTVQLYTFTSAISFFPPFLFACVHLLVVSILNRTVSRFYLSSFFFVWDVGRAATRDNI